MRRIIGLCGAAGSGKDEVAKILAYDYAFSKRSFAEALREEVFLAICDESYRAAVWNKMPTECKHALQACIAIGCQSPWTKPTSPEMRRLLQLWGTEFRRAQDPDYLVKRDAETLPDEGNFVYTDARFPNEQAHIKAHDGVMFRVMRPGYGPGDHESERHYLKFQCLSVIHNSGTLDDLRREVGSAMWILEDQ